MPEHEKANDENVVVERPVETNQIDEPKKVITDPKVTPNDHSS